MLTFQRARLISGGHFNIRKVAGFKNNHIKSRLAKELRSCLYKRLSVSSLKFALYAWSWQNPCSAGVDYRGCLCVFLGDICSRADPLLFQVTSWYNELHRASSLTLQNNFILVTTLLKSQIPRSWELQELAAIPPSKGLNRVSHTSACKPVSSSLSAPNRMCIVCMLASNRIFLLMMEIVSIKLS